jgi:hypothetical protein
LLRRLVSATNGISTSELEPNQVSALLEHHLAQHYSPDAQPVGLPFAFVRAINFELTYGCNLACTHCLQDALRPKGTFNWISTDAVIRTLQDAKWLGLTTLGVNFTGGETFTPGSPILELLAAVRDIGTPVRANTNAWWGNRINIKIGDRHFANDEAVMQALSECKLGMLALSLDNRYDQYPELLDRVVRVASLCEAAGQPYEVVATNPRPDIMQAAWSKLTTILGGQPQYLSLTPMDMVDIGAAALENQPIFEPKSLADLTKTSPCAGQGFHRPYYLHVAPDGGIRSCMYAPNADWHGNIVQQRLPAILNNAPENPVYQLFHSDDLTPFIDRYITPWQHLYKQVTHGCAASALIARIAAAVHRQETKYNRPLTAAEMEQLHRSIGRDYHLASAAHAPLTTV